MSNKYTIGDMFCSVNRDETLYYEVVDIPKDRNFYYVVKIYKLFNGSIIATKHNSFNTFEGILERMQRVTKMSLSVLYKFER